MSISEEEVLLKLCVYDARHPAYSEQDEEFKPAPNAGCYCDNCFYGRHKLAVEVLRLRELTKNYCKE